MYSKIKNFLIRSDPQYDTFVRKAIPSSKKALILYLVLHLVPGFIAFLELYFLREPFMQLTGLSSMNAQFVFLITIAIGWEIILTFLLLRFIDKLSIRESLAFLNLDKFDIKGVFVILPIVFIVFTIISLPYVAFIYDPIRLWLDSIPLIHMQPWHIFNVGYYTFPLPLLIVVILGNFFGEEIYFRGYLLKKIGSLKGDWLISNILFEVYHIWQAPINWPYILVAPLIPFSFLMKWRKNLYVVILFHVLVNIVWGEVTYMLIGK